MNMISLNKYLIVPVSLAFSLGIFSIFPLVAAGADETRKVQTQRIIVPEEKPAQSEGAEDGGEADVDEDNDNPDATDPGSAEIPADALPSLKPPSDTDENADETPTPEGEDSATEQNEKDTGTPPEIQRDLSKLPEPVRRMRELILETAKKGDLEALRNLIGVGESATILSIGGLEGDPIEFMREASGDQDGYEILAILIEVLESGYVHIDNETDEEVYVWPYFFAWPLDKLSPEQRVELYRVLTAGDVQDSENFGSYIFYRVGIKPDGAWVFFVAGD